MSLRFEYSKLASLSVLLQYAPWYAVNCYVSFALLHGSMTRLVALLLGLLRRLLSSPFITRSIKRLLLLIRIIQRQFFKDRPPSRDDSRHVFIPLPSETSHVTSFPMNDPDVICPSLQPPSREADSNFLHVPYADDEQSVPRPIYSPTPQRGYLLPYANASLEEIGSLTQEEHNSDAISISSQRSAKSSSPVSPPLSPQGLRRISSRPGSRSSSCHSILRPSSRNSQRPYSSTSLPIKVSRAPTPESINMAFPAGVPRPPPPRITLVPMSTATIQRWNRNIAVSVHIICMSIQRQLNCHTQPNSPLILSS
jgi:hypothetical protein